LLSGAWFRLVGHWNDPLYRQSYLMLASTGVSAGTGLLFWVVAALTVRPDALGVAAGLVAANSFLSYLTSLALPYAMLRYGAVVEGTAARVNGSVLVSTATSVLAAVVFGAAAPLVSPSLAPYLRGVAGVALFAAAGVGAALSVLLDNLLTARRRAGTVLARNAAAGVLKLLPLAWLSAGDSRGVYLAVTLPSLVTALLVLVSLGRLVPGYRVGPLRDPEMFRFAWRNYPGSLLSGAPQFALPLLAVNVLGPYRYAFFYMPWSMAQIVYLVPSVISNISLSQGTAASAGTLATRGRRLAFALLAPIVAGAVVVPALLLRWYGESYVEQGTTPLRLLMLAAVPWTVVILAKSRLRTEHRFTAMTALSAVFCVLSLALPVGFGQAWSGTGMAAGWLLAVSTAAACAFGIMRRRQEVTV
jgi:O-antigen/teichoic acid export membrane protein